jgi:hypothetical protein
MLEGVVGETIAATLMFGLEVGDKADMVVGDGVFPASDELYPEGENGLCW